VFLFITQFGFCTIYILFIARNLEQVLEHYVNWTLPIRLYQVIVLFLVIPLTFIRTLRFLAPFSAIANVFMVVGLAIIMQYCVRNLPTPVDQFDFVKPIGKLIIFFGMAIYSYEGIGVILPIENSMKDPRDFRGWTGVLNISMMLVTVLYITLGFFGYLRFGEDIKGTITLNLPMDNVVYVVVKLMFAFAIYISYALQFYVPVCLIERKFVDPMSEGTCKNVTPYLLRTGLVIVTFLISIVVPHLELMIALIGAFASSALALVLPPILEIVTFWDEGLGTCKWILLKDLTISIIGLTGFVAGTVVTVMEIIQTFQHDANVKP
jgi:proton-coupled amino acid transporter